MTVTVRHAVTPHHHAVTSRSVTQAEADAEAEDLLLRARSGGRHNADEMNRYRLDATRASGDGPTERRLTATRHPAPVSPMAEHDNHTVVTRRSSVDRERGAR